MAVCLVGCVCCGLSCCCGCCCSCCERRPSRPRPSVNRGQSFPSPPYGGYQPSFPQPPPYQPQPTLYHPQHVPQYDSNRGTAIKSTFNEDALPPMPSWDAAPERRILVETELQHQEDIELGHLNTSTGQDKRTFTNTPQANSYGVPGDNVNLNNYRAQSGYQGVEQDYFNSRSVASPISPNLAVRLPTPLQRTYGHRGGELSPIHTTPAYAHRNHGDHEVSPITPHQTYPLQSIEYG